MSDITVPLKQDLEADALTWAARARGLRIMDRESCLNASQLLKSVKLLRAQVQSFFAPHIEAAMETKRKADAARKALVDEKDRMEAPLVDAEGVLKRSLLSWESKQEELRLVQERALQAAAQARAEALTLEAAAAMELEATTTGNAEMLQEAHDIFEQPIEAPVVAVAKSMPKVHGITYRDAWKAHPDIDVKVLAAAVGNGTAPTRFVTPNLTAINQYGRATQGAEPVPGIRWFNDRQIAAKG